MATVGKSKQNRQSSARTLVGAIVRLTDGLMRNVTMVGTLLSQFLERKGLFLPEFDHPVHLPVDHIYGHDRNTYRILNELNCGNSFKDLADLSGIGKLRLFADHYSPPPNLEASSLHAQQRRLASETGAQLFDVGAGVGHQIAIEGLVLPGDVAIGIDSHLPTVGCIGALGLRQPPPAVAGAIASSFVRFDTPKVVRVELIGRLPDHSSSKDLALYLATYGPRFFEDKLIEFGGDGFEGLTISDRATLANLSTDFNARGALCEVDEATLRYIASTGATEAWGAMKATPADYDEIISLQLNKIEPIIAYPGSIFDVRPLYNYGDKISVDVVYVGTCTNGRQQDFAEFLQGLGGRRLASGLRVIMTPASRGVMLSLVKSGVYEKLVELGAIFNPPGCGGCMGLHQGFLSDSEVCVATGSRNTAGRMGAATSKVFLASPHTAGLIAQTGSIHITSVGIHNDL